MVLSSYKYESIIAQPVPNVMVPKSQSQRVVQNFWARSVDILEYKLNLALLHFGENNSKFNSHHQKATIYIYSALEKKLHRAVKLIAAKPAFRKLSQLTGHEAMSLMRKKWSVVRVELDQKCCTVSCCCWLFLCSEWRMHLINYAIARIWSR